MVKKMNIEGLIPKEWIEEGKRQLARIDELEKAVKALTEKVAELSSAIAQLVSARASHAGPNPSNPIGLDLAALLPLLKPLTEKSDLDKLADVITKARAISDAINPPSIWDKVMTTAFARMLVKSGFVTEDEAKQLIESK